jgi:predicted hotdog family 3-hydroxylacyl-ACP dehydratase
VDVKDLPAIETLLPHRKPMRLVDRILEIDENHIRTSSVVGENWPLCSKEGAEMILAVEIIAQSAEALYNQRKNRLGEPQIDFLVGIKDARFYGEILPLHGELTADVWMVSAIGNYGVFRGDLKYGAEILCEAIVQGLEPEPELWESIMSSRRGVITDG